MKAKFEMGGYEIEIEETEDSISVKAIDGEGEVVEEFTLEVGEEGQGQDDESQDDEEIKSFDDFDEEPENDELGAKPEEGEEMPEEDEEKTTLESFQSFINKRK